LIIAENTAPLFVFNRTEGISKAAGTSINNGNDETWNAEKD
jgi:hypothetical protein